MRVDAAVLDIAPMQIAVEPALVVVVVVVAVPVDHLAKD